MVRQNPASKAGVDELLANGEGGHDRFVAILSQEFMTSLKVRYPEIEAAVAQEYAARFTAAELDEITAFYSSGTGAKVLRLMPDIQRSEEHTSELQSLMRQSYAVFCLKNKRRHHKHR